MADRPDFIDRYIDLAQPRLGARVIEASDDFFAPKERLIKPEAPVFIADRYDENGKWMDGWESRRKRDEGHDYCIIRLCPGTIHGLDITTLKGDSQHFFELDKPGVWTHLRLNIYPDGGIARLRVYGVAHYDWSRDAPGEWVDLAAMARGGRALACADMHYGHMSNLIAPGRGVNMGDGWETRRRREPGNDWLILQLAQPGRIRRVEVDTAWFKGNYPARCSLHGAMLGPACGEEISATASYWHELLPQVPLGPDRLHAFEQEVIDSTAFSHVRFDIYPDGGVSRLRLFGDRI